MLCVGAVLELDRFLFKHVGLYIGQGFVLQNHFERGEEVVPYNSFHGGSAVKLRSGAVDNPQTVLQRVQTILASPARYDLLRNNCEHTAYRALDGNPRSPQLALYGLVIVVGGLLVATARAQ